MKKHSRSSDGMYHIKGQKFKELVGKRAAVWHGNAYKTKGDLVKSDLIYTKRGRIVSKKKHVLAKKEKRLQQHGYFTKKGKFGFVKKAPSKTLKKRSKKSKK